MEGLAALEGTTLAQLLRFSRWGYAAVNGAHILGIALLVGAIVPLNLRFFGLWPAIPRHLLVRVLVPIAATGLGIAVVAGILLFSVRAREYATLGVFQMKLALVAVGILSAVVLHRAHGFLLREARDGRLIRHAALSTICWIGALVCGRLIAFVAD